MANQNKILITFSRKFTREWEHLQSLGNKSKYIAELIKADIDKNDDLLLDENGYEKLKAAMRDVLDEYEFGIVANRKDNEPDYSDKIDDLFNI